jgi:hypothetical protein
MSCEPEIPKLPQLDSEQKQELITLIGEFLVKHFPEGLTPMLEVEVSFNLSSIEDSSREDLLNDDVFAVRSSVSSLTGGCVLGGPPNLPQVCGWNKRWESK